MSCCYCKGIIESYRVFLVKPAFPPKTKPKPYWEREQEHDPVPEAKMEAYCDGVCYMKQRVRSGRAKTKAFQFERIIMPYLKKTFTQEADWDLYVEEARSQFEGAKADLAAWEETEINYEEKSKLENAVW